MEYFGKKDHTINFKLLCYSIIAYIMFNLRINKKNLRFLSKLRLQLEIKRGCINNINFYRFGIFLQWQNKYPIKIQIWNIFLILTTHIILIIICEWNKHTRKWLIPTVWWVQCVCVETNRQTADGQTNTNQPGVNWRVSKSNSLFM